MRTSAPLSRRWVANVWRSVCTVTGLLKPAAAQAERQAACKTLGTSGRSSSRPGNNHRFGRMNRPRPCWAPAGIRPEVASQLVREYIYLYGAVSPKDGICVYLIMPTSNTACFQTFLTVLSRRFARHDILLRL